MKTNETLQGNRILAEFMGLKPGYNSYTKKYNWGDGIFFMTNGDTIEEVMDAIVGYAKYHSSWDWLMPVVEKIESFGFRFEIALNEVDLYDIENDRFSTSVNFPDCDGLKDCGLTKIHAAFLACVEFAKWYKNQAK
jgi:hypothetical protein